MDVDHARALRGGSAGTRVRARGGRGLGRDGASASGASLLDLGRAGPRGLCCCFGRGRPREAAGSRRFFLLGVVLVQSKCELVLHVAHAIRAEFARGGVAVQSTAVRVSADDIEETSELLVGQAAVGNTGRCIVHAAAQGWVGTGRQGGGLGTPVTAHGRAGLQCTVGGCVRSLVSARGGGTLDLVGVGGEVGHLADARAVHDGHQTWNRIRISIFPMLVQSRGNPP